MEQLQLKLKFLAEIVLYIIDDLRLGRCGEAGYRDRLRKVLLLLQRLQKIADVEVIHTEIVSPGGETVGLIDHETGNFSSQQQVLNCFRPQGFR